MVKLICTQMRNTTRSNQACWIVGVSFNPGSFRSKGLNFCRSRWLDLRGSGGQSIALPQSAVIGPRRRIKVVVGSWQSITDPPQWRMFRFWAYLKPVSLQSYPSNPEKIDGNFGKIVVIYGPAASLFCKCLVFGLKQEEGKWKGRTVWKYLSGNFCSQILWRSACVPPEFNTQGTPCYPDNKLFLFHKDSGVKTIYDFPEKELEILLRLGK